MRKIFLPLLLFPSCTFLYSQQLHWAVPLQSTSTERVKNMTIDDAGYVYATGDMYAALDFDPSSNMLNVPVAGAADAFVAKYDSIGNVRWAFNLDCTIAAEGKDITTDHAGNIFVTGTFQGTIDLDPSSAQFILTANPSGYDAFLAKYDTSGNFTWGVKYGDTNMDYGLSVAADASGNIFVAGTYQNTVDMDPGAGQFFLSSFPAGVQTYVSKFNSAGQFQWAFSLGSLSSSCTSGVMKIKLDAQSNIIIAGSFQNATDFDPSTNTVALTPNLNAANSDGYIAKYDQNGNYLWAFSLGAASGDALYGMDVDVNDNIYVTGSFAGTVDFNPGPGTNNLTPNGSRDIFVAKYTPAGHYTWAFSEGGAQYDDMGWGICTDPSGNVFVGGYFTGTVDLDPGVGVASFSAPAASSNNVGFISKYSSAGNYIWAFDIQGASASLGQTMIYALAPGINSESVYAGGYFYGSNVDFDPTAATYPVTNAGQIDAMLLKYNNHWGGVGIAENQNNDFSVGPNPFLESITLNFKNENDPAIDLFNSEGKRLIFRSTVNEAGLTIYRDDLPPGIYYLRIVDKSGIVISTDKIIAY